MSEVPFHATRMGQRFYEHTVPELVRQIALLNENIERLVSAAEKIPTTPTGDPDHGQDDREAPSPHPR